MMPIGVLAQTSTIDLSTLIGTYVVNDNEEYIFTGTGTHGIKVESGNPRIVLKNASITVGEGSAIDVTSGSNATIFVLGDNTIGTTKTESWDAPCGGIFVAEGGTVNITSNGTDNILRAHGTLAAAIGGKYVYAGESYNAGSISISNVTVYAYTNNFYASAIGAAGVGTCGTINITNAVVYAYGAGDEYSSAPGIGSAWSLVGWPETIPVVIISESEIHTFRYNSYSDYIGYLGDKSGDTYATDEINCGEGGSVKSSTIYCYTGLDATTTDKVVKYGALGGLLKEDGTCEGEHSFTGNICDNCGYCSCTHEGGELTYAPTEDGSQHTATWTCCGATVTEAHSGGSATCSHLAECEHCGAEYGELDHNNHEKETVTNGIYDCCGRYEPAILVTEENYATLGLAAEYNGYYAIGNAGQLLWYGSNANGKSGVLTSDIQIGTKEVPWNEWASVGVNGGMIFDGNGHTVEMHFTYDNIGGDANSRAVGLFNGTDGAIIRNLVAKGDINCNSTYRVGAISHSGYGVTFENIVSYVNITNESLAPTGGIVGQFGRNTGASRMFNCAVYANICGAGEVGGLVGKGWGGTQYYIIKNCSYSGTVSGAEITVGALVGRSATSTNGANVSITNTYYYTTNDVPTVGSSSNNIGTNEAQKKSAEQFASGEVAMLLGEAWGQNIDGEGVKDAYPIVGGAKVYYGYIDCAAKVYTNNENVSEEKIHKEFKYEANYDGTHLKICLACGDVFEENCSGEANCTHLAECEHCGAEFGDIDPDNHIYHGSICIECGHFDAEAAEVEIYDGYYSRVIIDDDYDVEKLTYYRELPNQEWNSLYVPFEIEVTDELLEDYEVAYMNNMHTYDADEDGSFDKMEMEIIKIKNGTLKANYPYFIRAKNTEAMDMNLVIENALVESTVERTVSCQSIRSIFELRGIYKRMRQLDFAEMYGTHYAISTEGGWWQTERLNPFRAYLTIIPRSGTPVNAPAMRSIGITVGGEENTTGVTEVNTESGKVKTEIYDLQGRRINEITESGIYIVDGKKVIVK